MALAGHFIKAKPALKFGIRYITEQAGKTYRRKYHPDLP
jgi:hypothetical protein